MIVKGDTSFRPYAKNTFGKEKLISILQGRLDWYIFQATLEQFDENEVAALISLLFALDKRAMSQIPDVEQAYERFKKYVALKEDEKKYLG